MNPEDYLNKLEKEGFKFPEFNEKELPQWIIVLTIQNTVYLEHIVEELYPAKKRKMILADLAEKAKKKFLQMVSVSASQDIGDSTK